MKKQLLSAILALALLLSFSACTDGKKPGVQGTETVGSEETAAPVTAESKEETSPETEPETEPIAAPDFPEPSVKNVIFLIADGGGYDNLTLADQVKEELVRRGLDRIAGAKTPVTVNGIKGETHTGTYLLDYLVGSANTMLPTTHGTVVYSDGKNNHAAYITDSSAAGTALSGGYKTTYCYSGVDSNQDPRASLTELAKMNGKSVGIVSNKSCADATPLAFLTAHSVFRYEYHDNALQAVLADADVALFEGTYYGDLYQTTDPVKSAHTADLIFQMGYELLDGRTSAAGLTAIGAIGAKSRLEAIMDGSRKVTKLWGPMLGITNDDSDKVASFDTAADLISYDIYGEDKNPAIANQPSLLLMAQTALKVLENGENENGFFLMVEGGCLDNSAEGGCLREATGEYLAFDETFAYCVQWAKDHGDETLVIACPDHDSGGIYGFEDLLDPIVDAIITGKIKAKPGSTGTDQTIAKKDGLGSSGEWNTKLKKAGYTVKKTVGRHDSHTDMCVPVSLYCPAETEDIFYTASGLKKGGSEETVRRGTSLYYVPNENVGKYDIPLTDAFGIPQYRSSALNAEYIVENTVIAPAIAAAAGLGNLDAATSVLYVPVGSFYNGMSGASGSFSGPFGEGTVEIDVANKKTQYSWYFPMDFTLGPVSSSRNTITYNGKPITKIGNCQPRVLYVLDVTSGTDMKTATSGTLFLPQSVLVESGLAYAVNFRDAEGKEYLASLTVPVGEASFVLPTETLPVRYPGKGKAIASFTLNGKEYAPGASVSTKELTGSTVEIAFRVGA